MYAHYCRTVITNKYVDYGIHENKSLTNLFTDHYGCKQRLLCSVYIDHCCSPKQFSRQIMER